MAREIQIIIIFILGIFVIPHVLGLSFPQNTYAEISHSVRVGGAVASGVNCNITIFYPNKTILVNYQPMTDMGNYFNYTLSPSQTAVKGEYDYDITCLAPNGLNSTDSFSYLINLGGVESTEQRNNTLLFIVGFFLLIGLGLLYLAFVTAKKMPVMFSFLIIGITFLLIGINFLLITIQDEIINPKVESFITGFTTYSTFVFWGLGISLFAVWFITMLVNIFMSMAEKKNARYEI